MVLSTNVSTPKMHCNAEMGCGNLALTKALLYCSFVCSVLFMTSILKRNHNFCHPRGRFETKTIKYSFSLSFSFFHFHFFYISITICKKLAGHGHHRGNKFLTIVIFTHFGFVIFFLMLLLFKGRWEYTFKAPKIDKGCNKQ